MFVDKYIEMLCDFGLTGNQARVYMAIVQLRLASVGKISKVSKVRREDVYRILPKLEKMGLIEKVLGTPTKIRAIPVEEGLSLLIKRERTMAEIRMAALMTKKDELLKRFIADNKSLRVEEEEAHFALLSERESIINKTVTLFKNAEKEVAIVASKQKFVQLMSIVSDSLKKIVRKGMKVRTILEEIEPEDLSKGLEEYISSKSPLQLRFTHQPLHHFLIVDNKQLLVTTSKEGSLTEFPVLWTDNPSLVGLLQTSFEDLWHTAANSKDIETAAVSEKVTRFVERMRPTDHIIFMYQSQEAKHSVLFNYLKVGLENGEAGVYVAAEENPKEIRDAMKRFGIEVEKCEKTGALHILGYNDIYILEGKFNMSTTMDLWKKLYDEALVKGFKGLRVTGEMACFFEHNLIDELVEYERALHRVLDLPMIAICAYNAQMLTKASNPINLYTELVRAHGTVLFAGIDNRLGKIEIRKS